MQILPMSNWNRVGDNQKAAFGLRDIVFPLADGSYVLNVNDDNQDYLICRHGESEERWEILLKESNGSDFRLSGMTHSSPGILEDAAWFQLVLNERPTVSYWGDQVLIRKDAALAAD